MPLVFLLLGFTSTIAQPLIRASTVTEAASAVVAGRLLQVQPNIQYFVVVPWNGAGFKLDPMLMALLQRGAHIGIPFQLGNYYESSPWTRDIILSTVLKHQQTKIVYFSIPTFNPSIGTYDPREPFLFEKATLRIDKNRDTVFHSVSLERSQTDR